MIHLLFLFYQITHPQTPSLKTKGRGLVHYKIVKYRNTLLPLALRGGDGGGVKRIFS
jgi:hypothetical protein